ncbi:hypothetical protein STSP2_01355 [Anaerohalosphaera lusitana]|uniref:Uncharacterized protein n=2 Tax=Anaerohalosphaera lusitana TaxID=1936003 RepID=A0A1U9NKT3_9BACT|nr:hypothetical protein STSP2_01355 [Anaerohalosphaera lusitana]
MGVASLCPAESPEDNAPTGALRITGKFVRSITLESVGTEEVNTDGTLEVPTGSHQIRKITLENGWTAYPYQLVDIKAGQTTDVKLGGPLKQKITANRQGGYLNLDHSVEGVCGKQYRNGDNPPAFTIYKGDTKVHSGKFAYG